MRLFKEIWCIDFEFYVPEGERPEVLCMVAMEVNSGRCCRLWIDQLTDMPPFAIGSDTLVVAYYASAEISCFLSLGWPMPKNLMDLYVEFRCLHNGLSPMSGYGLLGALTTYGIAGIDGCEKKEMRELAMRGGFYSKSERSALLEYCETDVVALSKLLSKMLGTIDLPRALLRGRYMKAVAHMEWNGVPIDTETLQKLRIHWEGIKTQLVAEVDSAYGVYGGLTFKQSRFEQWLRLNDIPWPRHPSGTLDLQDDTFKEMVKAYPAVGPLRELRASLSGLRLNKLTVGSDGRNRCLLSPFSSKTSRNQPSNAKFIFGPSAWYRGLIKPREGFGIAYIDYSQQEFAIAAALSKDDKMIVAYESGDPYLEFAKQAGAVPQNATKNSHPAERKLYKACVLAVQYGMGSESLAQRINCSVREAKHLLQRHRETYNIFWEWSDAALNFALTQNYLVTALGWRIRLGSSMKINDRSLRNFPMQANGAEILRLACIFATETGITVCAPVHDALLIEASIERLDDDIRCTKDFMQKAGEIVLGGFKLRTDVDVVRWPDRYMDERGVDMWERVSRLIMDLD